MDELASDERRYLVFFTTASGKTSSTTCVIRAGYSTVDDISKMIALKYGAEATVTGWADVTGRTA